MRKIIIFLLCCGALVSIVGCGGNTAPPPSESPPTMVAETIITETPPVAAVEPTEKEKEPTPTESKEQATEPTVTATEPITTTQPKEETKPGIGKTGRAIGGGKYRGKRLHHYCRNGRSAEGRNYNPTQAQCRFGSTEGRRIHKSIPHRAGRSYRNGHPRTD